MVSSVLEILNSGVWRMWRRTNDRNGRPPMAEAAGGSPVPSFVAAVQELLVSANPPPGVGKMVKMLKEQVRHGRLRNNT